MKGDFVSEIKTALSGVSAGAEIFVYDSVGSTNDEARKYAARDSGKNAFFIAREQT